ncbi:MAG: response regulator, partial [Chloroflexota bacterium]
HPEMAVEVLEATDGQQAIDIVDTNPPDIIFLDVMMPVLNGFEVCRHVKLDRQLTQVKVIMLTAKGQAYDEERGLKLGADRYMTKPFSFEDILAVIDEYLN